jgi:TonB family protein
MNALLSSPVLSWLLSYLFNALWQIPLIFAAAWFAARMLRRTHPRVEHRVWVAALLLQIALPACSLHIGSLWASMWVTLRSLTFFWKQPSVIRGAETTIFFGPGVVGGKSLHLPPSLLAGVPLAYVCCALYFAGRIAWGLVETRTLARSATRLTLTGDTALRCSQYCRRFGITDPPPEIAASPRVIGPITVGFRRGLLLLPSAFLETIAPRDLDAVLAHELAHIRRRDFTKNVLYGLVSLPVAWHPLLWRTRARIAESRELVCDAIAADAIAGRRQYAQSLLRLASMLAGRPAVPTLHAIGILSFNEDRNALERRVMTLTHQPAPMNTTRRIVVATACSVLALATCTSALALHTEVSALTPSAENQASGPAASTKIHVKSRIMQGQRISGDNPVYPPKARAKKIEGAVVIDTTIGKDGGIENLRVVKSPDPSLAESALKAVRTWRYHPYLLNGEPVEVETTVNVIYSHCGSEANCKKLLDEMPDS